MSELRRGSPQDCLAGGGEAGELARAVDWAKTAIGPVAGWSQALRSTAALVLHNQSGMLLWWGPEFVQLYNDAYRPVLGDKHPRAMGQPFSECWKEVFHIVGPMAERPFRGGPASTSDDLPLLIERKVPREEAHFRIAYSPVPDETAPHTGIGGVLATVTEITDQVYGERQLRTLRELGAHGAAEAKTVESACQNAAARLGENAWDVPFALFYLLSSDGKHARLAAGVGFDSPAFNLVAPAEVDLSLDRSTCPWPIRQVATTQRSVVVEDLAQHGAQLPRSPWSEQPRSAIVLPLASSDEANGYGVVVFGISPHRVLDASYRGFFELASAQVVTAVRNARAFEAERKRAEALAAIDRAKTAFFSNVSHEFRTPLTLMLGPTEDLLRGNHGALSAEQREQLELLRRNELRLQRLVNALLEFSRIEAGRMQATYAATDLAALTRDLASAFRAAVERAGLKFTVDCPALDEPIYVDRDMWEQIVLNLLSNAFKFTFQGEIAIALRSQDSDVVLEVKDTGVGVRPEHVPRLFERFHRVEGTRARTHEGSGIGLALVQELVRLQGGKISAASEYGRGTSFTLTIPKGTAHLAKERIADAGQEHTHSGRASAFSEEAVRWLPDQPSADAPVPSTQASGGGAGAGRVLIADDNADMREYLRRILGSRWTVETVSDGLAALEAAKQQRPDLILSDVMMPALDGFGLLKALREDASTQGIPVIMLSARAGEESRVDGLQAGADDYLVKPFSARELVARVEAQIVASRLRHTAEEQRRFAEAAKEQAEATAKALERAVRLSEIFVGILGHDLRNPLSAITTSANLLESRADSERIAKPVARIVASAYRMERMIAQLLDFTRLRLGEGLSLEPARIDLRHIARLVIDELEPVHRQKLELVVEGTTVGIWDGDRLAQLLSNLAANACQHGTRGSRVRVRVDGTKSDMVEIEVTNDGVISEQLLPRLFEPLQHSVTSGRRSVKNDGGSGLGLGLFITQQIVLAHAGSIEVVSNEAQGTSFIVRLPRQPTPSATRVFAIDTIDGRA